MDEKRQSSLRGEQKEKRPTEDEELMHAFKEAPSQSPFFSMKTIGIFVIVIILGVGTGFALAKGGEKTASLVSKTGLPVGSNVEKGETYGSEDTSIYSDDATGVVRKGGVGIDGAFHLERPGGESQTVAMTSSEVDLSQFVGRKVTVWGTTQTAQVAGWLMDVGRVEVIE